MMIDLLRQALANVRAHTGRTVVALVGIVWGTASVVMLVPWGRGLHDTLVAQASSGGRRMMAFFPGRSASGVGAQRRGREIRFKRDDAQLIATQLHDSVDHVTAGVLWWAGLYLRHGLSGRRAVAIAAEPAAADILELRAARGRLINDRDQLEHRRVVVLGDALAQQLFREQDAINQRVEANGISFTVVGVLERKGDQVASLGPPDDRKVWIPLTTFQALISGDNHVNFIAVAPHNVAEHHAVEQRVRAVLGTRHGFAADDHDALTVFDVVNFIDLFGNLTRAIHIFVTVVAVVTLMIGAIGVMNVMLLSVSERSGEMGLRRAVGATRGAILVQVLAEVFVIMIAGGMGGIALGWWLSGYVPISVDVSVHARAFASVALFGTTAGLIGVAGIAAGLWPALRAARLDPVVALRHEQ